MRLLRRRRKTIYPCHTAPIHQTAPSLQPAPLPWEIELRVLMYQMELCPAMVVEIWDAINGALVRGEKTCRLPKWSVIGPFSTSAIERIRMALESMGFIVFHETVIVDESGAVRFRQVWTACWDMDLPCRYPLRPSVNQ